MNAPRFSIRLAVLAAVLAAGLLAAGGFVLRRLVLAPQSNTFSQAEPPAATCVDVALEQTVQGALCRPDAAGGPLPAVIVLPGCGGPPELRDLAKNLAGDGFVTLYVDYFVRTPRRDGFCSPGSADQRAAAPVWLDTIADAAAWLRSQPSVDPERIGIIGYSLGAALALTSVGEGGYRVAVLFSNLLLDFLPPRPESTPPVLILHGDRDRSVNVRQARQLHATLGAAARPVDLHVYPGGGHAWNGDRADDAQARALAFLRQHLAQ